MKKAVRHQMRYWFPVYVWAVLIFYFSSGSLTAITPPIGRAVFAVSDGYYKHMFGYGFLTFLLWRAFNNSNLRFSGVFAIITAFVYGGCNELYQGFVPGRNPSLLDAFSNFIGGILVQPLVHSYKSFKKKIERKR